MVLKSDSPALPPSPRRKTMKVLLALLALLALWVGMASAQGGYIVQTPGKLPAQITPNVGGGYTIFNPGQLPSTVLPNPGGGYTIYNPGRLPTIITPTPTVQTPSAPPSTARPSPFARGWIDTTPDDNEPLPPMPAPSSSGNPLLQGNPLTTGNPLLH
jgi:hypothetical protein